MIGTATHRAVLFCGLAAVSGLPLIAQPRQTFRTATRLIEVSVVVTAGNGKPVRGLTRADFTVEEDGKAQPISFFEIREATGAAAAAHPGDRPHAFSNAVSDGSGVTTVLLLDRLNASFESQWHARRHIDRYLAAIRPGDRIALYVLDGGVRVLHDFSSDGASLRRALDAYHARTTAHYDASTGPPPEEGEGLVWLADPSENVPQHFSRRRMQRTFEAMETLAGHLAGIGGRKNVVWVSEGFALPTGLGRMDVLHHLHRATEALSDAQASVYPVDARGLVGGLTVGPRGEVMFNSMGTVMPSIDTMGVVADDTGGRVFAHTNALDRSITRAVDDARVTYVLGYYPPASRLDGRFRRIDVKVARKQVQVRHRAGYVAAPPPPGDAATRENLILAALEAPLQATGIGLAADMTRADGDDVELSIRIDPGTLTLERDGRGWIGTADLLVAQVTPSRKGEVLATIPLAITLDDDARARALEDGLLVVRRVTLQPKILQLRIVARDVPTGRVGSLVIPASSLTVK